MFLRLLLRTGVLGQTGPAEELEPERKAGREVEAPTIPKLTPCESLGVPNGRDSTDGETNLTARQSLSPKNSAYWVQVAGPETCCPQGTYHLSFSGTPDNLGTLYLDFCQEFGVHSG